MFDPGYVERSRLILWLYPRLLSSARFRNFVYLLPVSRARMALLGRYFHRAFHDWNEGDRAQLMQVLDPAVTVELFGGFGTYEGHEGMQAAWADAEASFGDARIEVSEVIDNRNGEIVLVGQGRGVGHSTGIDFSQPGALAWSIRGGMGMRARFFTSKADALKATGLRE